MWLPRPFQLFGLGCFYFSFILCLGCDPKPALPKSDFLAIAPALDEPYIFKFKNVASRELFGVEVESDAKKSTQIWGSTASGQLEIIWSGEVMDHQEGAVLSIDYGLKNLHWAEADQWDKRDWSWSEEIGGDPVVAMKRGGLSRSNPMGWMRGDPREYFLSQKNQALFWMDGDAYRKDGQLNPANTLDGPTETAAIGQYFLSGLPISEWAHRLLVPLPKTKALKDGLEWKRPFQRWYNVPPKALAVHEFWICRQIDRGWQLEMTLVDRQERIAGRNMDRPILDWLFQRKISVILSADDGMPIWLKWEESGGYVDQLPPLGGSSRSVRPKRHQWTNTFEADRT